MSTVLDNLTQLPTAKQGDAQIAGIPFDPNNVARSAISSAIGYIPYAGTIASKVLLLFWPENKDDVWPSIEKRATELINKMINKEKLKSLNAELQGLKDVIKGLTDYEPDTDNARHQFQDILNFLGQRQPQFCDPADPLSTLPLMVEWATLHVVFLKARCDNPASISEKPVSDETLQTWKNRLHEKIVYYHTQVLEAWTKAHSMRMAMIKVTSGSNPTWYTVADGLDDKEYTYTASATGHALGYGETARRISLVNRWELETMEKYLVAAEMWRMLDPIAPVKNWADDQNPALCWLLNMQEKPYDQHSYNPSSLVKAEGRIEHIDVWHGQTIERIEVKCVGKAAVGNGNAAGTRTRIDVPRGRYVKQIEAGLLDKMVTFSVLLDDGKRFNVNSAMSNDRYVRTQKAAYPEFGVAAVQIAERCCALCVTMSPVAKLPK
jgi:hypothetical protein